MNLKMILTSENVSNEILNNLDYLLTIIPEIKPMIGFNQKHPHHNLDVFMHTLEALKNSKNDYIIRLALLFHDIGKIGVPDAISQKNGKLDDDEYSQIKQHPNIGVHILSHAKIFKNIINEVCYLVKYHDTPITKEDVEKNYNLQLKRYEVQRCDTLAHNPLMNSKRISYLIKTKKLFK